MGINFSFLSVTFIWHEAKFAMNFKNIYLISVIHSVLFIGFALQAMDRAGIALDTIYFTEITKLILAGGDVNAQNGCVGETLLCKAVRDGYALRVRFLIRNGALVNIPSKTFGEIPLHLAARSGREDIAQILLDEGSEINYRTLLGFTPLHCAVFGGHEGLVRLLLARGASVNAKDNSGETPLFYASIKGYVGIVTILLQLGANLC